MIDIDIVRHVALFVVLIGATYTDLTSNRVPDYLTYPGIVFGGLLGFLVGDPSGDGLGGLQRSGMGFLVGFGLFLVLYAMHVVGGGDVKLMGAVGALTNWNFTFNCIIHTALIGGVLAILVLMWRGLARLVGGDEHGGAPDTPSDRPDGIPIKKIDPPADDAAPADDAQTAKADQPEAEKQTRKQPPSTIPYGLCIALGGFATYYLLIVLGRGNL